MNLNKRPGLAVVVSSPSGTGKTTICHRLIDSHEDYIYSISATTRKPRGEEVDGVDYMFMTEPEFEKAKDSNEFIEHACYVNNWYATPKAPLRASIAEGKVVMLDIDIQGGKSIKKQLPESITIFILPPSLEELKNRLKGRNTDSDNIINERLDTAIHELNVWNEYDYVVVNDDLDDAVAEVDSIINVERLKTNRLNDKDYWNKSLSKLLGLT